MVGAYGGFLLNYSVVEKLVEPVVIAAYWGPSTSFGRRLTSLRMTVDGDVAVGLKLLVPIPSPYSATTE